MFGEFLFDSFRVCTRFINFINSYNYGNICFLGMVDSLHCLGHNPVVGCYHQNGDVSDLCPPGAHCCESFVAGCIHKGNFPAGMFHLVGANMLSYSASFGRNYVRFPDGIQQGCFAMIHVPHHRYYTGSRLKLSRVFLRFLHQRCFDVHRQLYFNFVTEFACQYRSSIIIDFLVDCGHNTQLH
ncbi:MAG: hypothetical protein BWY80_00558 [Firmicutes bacterium ADurb.Bin456]|nr:MAG: hypothetical protein BWY80_00558 [Firmicutes bacterium ADurb.Bin456]